MSFREPILTKMVFYNSSSRNSGEIYDHTFTLMPDILEFKEDEYAEMELIQFSCKQSYFNISSSRNNKFYYNQGNGLILVTLTPGNYNVKDLATEIQTQLNASGTLIWTITYSLITLKYTFNYSGTPVSTPVVSQFSNLDGLAILGFSTTTTLTNGISSSKQLSIGNLDSIFLQCDLVSNTRTATNAQSRPVLAQIPVLCQLYGIIYYEATINYTPKIILKTPSNSNTISLQIKDKNNNLVLMTEDFNILWRVNIYKKDTFSFNKLMSMMTLMITKPLPNTRIPI
jgi:hypothetical protein